jgi:hypothetical protein
MLRLATLFLCLALAPASMAQELIHYWNFNEPASSPTWPQPLAANSGDGLITYTFVEGNVVSFGGTTTNAQGGDPMGGSFVVQNGSDAVNNGRYFELSVPTTGFEAITLSYATQRTSTGFDSQSFEYSLDGATFMPFTSITSIPGTYQLRSVDFSAVSGAENNPDFRIRVILDGGSSTSTAGNNRFDNITLTGLPLTGVNRPPSFTSVLPDRAIPAEKPFTFQYAAQDLDGDPLTFSLLDAPMSATIDPITGAFSWTPTESDAPNDFTVTVRVSDGDLSASTTAVLTVLPADDPAFRELFFSEYVEGSSNNKAIEIYNPTEETVDLSEYSLHLFFNGNTTSTGNISLEGSLAPGQVYVIAHSSAHEDIHAVADLITGTLSFNGDDAVVLRRQGEIIDVIGQVGVRENWGTAPVRTIDTTLRRFADTCVGLWNPDTVYDPADYFDGYPNNTFDGLGSHTSTCFGVEPPVDNTPPALVATLPSQFVEGGVEITFNFVGEDADGDALTYGLAAAPDGATLDASTGLFSWTASDPGVFTVKAYVSDGLAGDTTLSVIGVTGMICGDLEGGELRECLRGSYAPARTLGYDTAARDTMYGVIDLHGGFVRGIYTGFEVAVDDPSRARQIVGAGGINAEHVWPQSMGAGSEPMRSDLHNLFPSNASANSSRSNWPYGYVSPDNATSWWGRLGRVEPPPTEDFELYSRYGGQQFEPRDYAKGAVARASLYFYSIYENVADYGFALVQRDVLEEWGAWQADIWELERTAAIARYQRNVNPFIIDPTLAGRMLIDITLPDPITIAEARLASDGTSVTIEGVVTRAGGRFVRLQDETAGLTVFQTSGTLRTAIANGDVAEGDLLRVFGSMATFNDLRQVSPSLFEVISRENDLPAPVEVTLSEIADRGETYESMLIAVRGLDIETDDATFEAARTYSISDATAGAGTVDLRTPSSGEGAIIGQDVPAGSFDFVGVLGRFRETFQLQPINATDVRPVPVLTVSGSPSIMWPPNQKLQAYAVSDFVSSVAGGTGSISLDDVFVRRITSDEMPRANMTDIIVGSECRTFELRATRDGDSDGRVYTIELGLYDDLGTLGTASAQVHVPANQGRNTQVVDSGVAYEIVPDCQGVLTVETAGTGLASAEADVLPAEFALEQNYPNPFNPTTTVQYALPEAVHVRVSVFNLLGQEVARLVDQVHQPGRHEVQWNAGHLSSGMYVYVIDAGSFRESRRMVLLK